MNSTSLSSCPVDPEAGDLAPFSPQTRAALLAEFRAARDTRDVARGRDIYRAAAAHDNAHPDEPSLVDQLVDEHVTALAVAA